MKNSAADILLALDMMLLKMQDMLVAVHTLWVEQPFEDMLPAFNSFEIFSAMVASYFRCWLLMYIANYGYFQSDIVILSSHFRSSGGLLCIRITVA